MSRSGQCLCGAVQFEAELAEDSAHACHCGMCRRWSGSMGFAMEAKSVRFDGEENITVYPSSEWAERGFCRTCGTNLFYRLRENGMTMVWLGALDDLSGIAMGSEIYIDCKPPIYELAGDHPRLTEKEFLEKMGLA